MPGDMKKLHISRKVETLFRAFTHPAILFTIAVCINRIFFAKGGKFLFSEPFSWIRLSSCIIRNH